MEWGGQIGRTQGTFRVVKQNKIITKVPLYDTIMVETLHSVEPKSVEHCGNPNASYRLWMLTGSWVVTTGREC